MKDLGYSMDTGVLPVGRLPHALRRDNRYFGGQRLSLLVICLENQGNDSSNEHAELENSFPCNIHTCHPLSFTIGGKEASPPTKSRGTAYRGTTGSTAVSIAQLSTKCKGRFSISVSIHSLRPWGRLTGLWFCVKISIHGSSILSTSREVLL